MKSLTKICAAVTLVMMAGTASAYADGCSGRNHDTGTILGAGGGALIGGLASHSVGGAVIGGVAGGFAGNAIARSEDCHNSRTVRTRSAYYVDSHGRRHYYRR